MKTIIVDIDGTIADVTHRRHYIASKPKNWKAFEAAMHLDPVKQDIIELIESLCLGGDYLVVLATGRGEEHRETTLQWLADNNIYQTDDKHWDFDDMPVFTFEKLYMRPEQDNRPDTIVKREILDQIEDDGYHVWLAIDDRNSVVQMWRDAGVTCLQVAPGDF